MSEIARVTPAQIRGRILSGEAMLICAYDKDEKFQDNHLEGAISLSDFKTRLIGMPRDKELVFYCG